MSAPLIPYLDDTFVITECLLRKRQLLLECWYLPPRDDDPRANQPPMRLLYRTTDMRNARRALDWIDFGYLLTRTGQHTVVVTAVDGKGKPGAAVTVPIAGEPELLGLIRTGA